MAEDMAQIETGAPKAQQIAERWMRTKGIEKPQGNESKTESNNPDSLVGEAYDLFVEKQELQDQVVRSERQMMDPGFKESKSLSLEEKKELIRQGRIRTMLQSGGTDKSDIQIVKMSQGRVTEIDTRLDDIFSSPTAFEQFRLNLSRQVEVRHSAREATALDRFGQQAELVALRLARQAQVTSRALTSVERQVIEDNRALQDEANKRKTELVRDPEVFDRLRITELKKYAKQLDTDHYAETPSRIACLSRIERYWTEGKKVLLSGETGTGKTEMIKHASNKLFGVNPESVTGHQDMSIYELLGKTGFQVQVGDVFRPAPLIRAMTGREGLGQPFLFDEIDRAPNQAVMGIKTILNARPGEKGIKVQTDTAGTFDVGADYAVSATANIKSEKYQTATELDPAIVRVFDAPLEIDYIPAPEVYDLLLASLIDKRGGIPLSEQEANVMLKNLCDAGSWIQDAYQGKKIVTDPKSGTTLEARGQGTTGRTASLKKALLDPGRTMDMLKGWQGAQARGINFEDYINERVTEFINNRAYPEDDRYYLAEIFALKGFLKGVKVNQLSVPGLTQDVLSRWTGTARKHEKKQSVKSNYLFPDKVAKLDPYKRFKRPVTQEAEELLAEDEETETVTQSEDGEITGLTEAREIMEDDFFGPDELKTAFGYDFDRSLIPEIPFSSWELQEAKSAGNQFLMLYMPETSDGKDITMARINEDLKGAFEKDGKGNVLYDTDWYKNEDFFKTDVPRPAWKLVTKDVIPDSTNHNYLEQTQDIIDYVNTLYAMSPLLPLKYQEAVNEFVRERPELIKIISSNWQEAAKRLAALQINQMFRQTPVEALYTDMVYFQNKNERLLETRYAWTNRQASGGNLVFVGSADAKGVSVYDWPPDDSYDDVGVVLSR
jgi:MoxR-like ATPase/chorismate mutase